MIRIITAAFIIFWASCTQAQQIVQPSCSISGSTITCPDGSLTQSGGSPGGSTTQLQYNNAGAFGGISGWTTNGTTTITGSMPTAALGTSVRAFQLTNAGTAVTEIWVPGSNVSNPFDIENTMYGVGAGAALTPTYDFVSPLQNGGKNTFFGWHAGNLETTGANNAYFGQGACSVCVTASDNAFFGSEAGLANTTGSANTFLAQKAGAQNTTGSNNVYIGKGAAGVNTTASNNIFIGSNAGDSAGTGDANVIIGIQAGQWSSGGTSNVMIGQQAGQASTGARNTASSNTIIGWQAGISNTSGSQSVVIGASAGNAQTTGGTSVLVGYQAGKAIIGGSWNVMIGSQSGLNVTSGQGNIFLGNNSGQINSTGNNNSSNTFVAGSNDARWLISDVYFGKGIASTTATSYTIHGTGGSGSDNAGGAVVYSGGQGTGAGNGGNVQFAIAIPTATSSTPNSLTNIANFSGATGHFLWNTDNAYDIGATGATRPRAGYFGTSVTIGAGSAITSSGAGGALGTNAFTSTAYAPLASPTFTGTVTLPDASTATSTGISGVVKLALVGPKTSIIAGTTTTTASNALNNTSTGNITVSSTTGWPATGTLKTGGGNNTEFMSFSVVDGTTLNITARGTYSSTNAVHAGTVTLSYAVSVDAATTSSLPVNSRWSDGTQQVNAGSTGDASLFLGLNHATGLYFSGGAPSFAVNGAQVFSVSSTALTLPAGSSIALSGLSISSQQSATMQLGLSDAAVPVAQTLKVQSVIAGTAAANGANFTISGSLPTGTGTSGDIIIQTGVKTGSGTTQGTATTALTLKGETQAIVTSALDAASSAGGALQVAGGASVAKRLWIPAITASSGLQTAVLCQSSGGEMIADSVACLASSARFKNIRGPLSNDVVEKFMKLPIKIWAYKPEGIFKKGNWTRDRIGPIAEDVERLDARLVEYDSEGNVRAYSTEQLLAYTIKVVQEQQHQIDSLSARLR